MPDNKYPAKRYHATEAPRYVQNEDEDRALGRGWFDSPKKATAAAEKSTNKKADDKPESKD